MWYVMILLDGIILVWFIQVFNTRDSLEVSFFVRRFICWRENLIYRLRNYILANVNFTLNCTSLKVLVRFEWIFKWIKGKNMLLYYLSFISLLNILIDRNIFHYKVYISAHPHEEKCVVTYLNIHMTMIHICMIL